MHENNVSYVCSENQCLSTVDYVCHHHCTSCYYNAVRREPAETVRSRRQREDDEIIGLTRRSPPRGPQSS